MKVCLNKQNVWSLKHFHLSESASKLDFCFFKHTLHYKSFSYSHKSAGPCESLQHHLLHHRDPSSQTCNHADPPLHHLPHYHCTDWVHWLAPQRSHHLWSHTLHTKQNTEQEINSLFQANMWSTYFCNCGKMLALLKQITVTFSVEPFNRFPLCF